MSKHAYLSESLEKTMFLFSFRLSVRMQLLSKLVDFLIGE